MVAHRRIKLFILGFSLVTAMFSYYVWQVFKTPNFNVSEKQDFALLIPKGSNFASVLDTLKQHDVVRDQLSFQFLAKVMGVSTHVRPGRYLISSEMGNFELLRKMRNGRQDAIKVVINNFRLKEEIASKLSKQLPFDSTYIKRMLDSNAVAARYGLTAETISCLFIPDTYEVFWTSDFEHFLKKMEKAHKRFWTDARMKQASALGLTPVQVGILASIVYAESKEPAEQARIAGVYWNRLRMQMVLQADPTIVFAWKDFSIKRVTGKYTAINSPYNTYRLVGLPPGPISIPPRDVIDKVLHLEKHRYIYFCAKEDFSGLHNFAVSYADHLVNAAIYQRALDALKIH
jgi:UPF0755 protein